MPFFQAYQRLATSCMTATLRFDWEILSWHRHVRGLSDRILGLSLLKLLLTARIHGATNAVAVPDYSKPWVDLSAWQPASGIGAAGDAGRVVGRPERKTSL